MLVSLNIAEQSYQADLRQPIDISLALVPGALVPNAWYAPPFETSPVRHGDFIGAVAEGGAVNFLNVRLNPHGNGTHTECVGHISSGGETILASLQQYHFSARLVSLYPQRVEEDRVISLNQLKEIIRPHETEALIIRTLPNDERKLQANYSGANPPYIGAEALSFLVEAGIQHLLLDLPSVDREEDDGALAGHRAFWQYPDQIRQNATITELIYVNNSVPDGLYLLNIQLPSFALDAAPSKPVIYALQAIEE